MKSRTVLLTLIVLTECVLHDAVCTGVPMGTAFTYQGRFNSGGEPATGSYDFQFMLYDAAEAGSQVGSTLTRENITVSDGYFTTTLDFGSGIFTGNARWLQIAVRLHGSGSYATLTPRHELTPTPYTFYASYEGSANYIPKFNAGGMTQSTLYDSGGNIGIGTTSPAFGLQVNKSSLYNNDAGGAFAISDPTVPAKKLFMGYDAANDFAFISAVHTGMANKNIIFCCGNIGIGTVTPSHLLTTKDTDTVAAVNLSGVLYVDAANDRVGIGFDNPICALDIRGSGAGINVQGAGNPALELRSTSGGIPLVDFSNDASIDYDMRVVLMGDDTLTIDGGDVGVGTAAPVQKLDVSGTVRCVSVVQTSDEQLKTNIESLDGVLDRLGRVRAVSFQWSEKARCVGAKVGEKQIGVLAQELEQVFPELVTTPKPVSVEELRGGYPQEKITPDVAQKLQADAEATQYKAVDYSQLTVVLLQAVKELQAENMALQRRIGALEGKTE